MLLLKIANKSLFSPNLITQNYIQCLFHKIQILKFIKKETFSFYLGWLLVFLFTKFQTIKAKTNYFISYIYFSFINRQKLISYVININLSPTNTFINVNNYREWEKLKGKSEEDIVNQKSFSRHIPQNVKDDVWNRDDGMCVECGSNENIEFDHIIPYSKGGANTYRNIQLLCESCNRAKSDKMG